MRSFGDGLAALLGWKASLVGFGAIIGAILTRSGDVGKGEMSFRSIPIFDRHVSSKLASLMPY